MKEVCVIVPVYKIEPSESETLSFRRTLSVLRSYDISLVHPEGLELSFYISEAKNQGKALITKAFNSLYFKGVEGYNRLLLSLSFYQSFSDFRYILICQLDAYVFRDELRYWCDRGYDFIGAPLIGHYSDIEFSNKMRVGNGGFSLRKVDTAIAILSSRKNVFTSKQIRKLIDIKKKPYTRIPVWIMMMLGWRNKPHSVAAHWKYNEDVFWSGLLDNSRFALNKPYPKEALNFSFERFPSTLFKLNGEILPFGCHAWSKYEYDSFWKRHIGK